ncbi:MAG TPA: hypothetical protein VG456_20205 [Candidatus Sulfopaludibacter sp.]|jgi:photosystem II stability/assembly factor-like uncharacterized protein|nr:hypothetical protein [Candidatus Sulfopaludibacter sp.]
MRRLFVLFAGALIALSAQTFDQKTYAGLEWRMIGPFRGGRTVGLAGVADQPYTFYIGVNNGGVWKTDDSGITWRPIFDGQPTGSIGAVAVAPSDPNIVYVGTGEGLQRPDLSVGDGMYKSTDAGKTWRHLGLRQGQQIAQIIVDPANANRLFVAVMGHPYGPNTERGVYRSLDGGATFQRVLYKNEQTGAVDLAFDPSNPQTVYAVLWQAQQGPWENGAFSGPASGLFKSTDGGTNWTRLEGGLPNFAQGGLGRIGIGIAPSDPRRMYALVEARGAGQGLYRSNDAGATWRKVNGEERVTGRGSDFACVRVDPANPDVVYVANTSTYRSTDGGSTFTAIKGAPGGDDYHTIWINPKNPNIIALALDQGATISVNHGRTWSSWYNQPTAQLYHVSTDNQTPYWVYGGQQESGSVGIASRGNDGAITFREWHPVGAAEYAYVAPDPLNPNFVYGGDMPGEGAVTRWNRITGEVEHLGKPGRHLRTYPVIFSYKDPHILYAAMQHVMQTSDAGKTWTTISPDLSRETYDLPPSVASYSADAKKQATRRGVVYALAPSHRDTNVLWAGTDDGLIHVTHDGGATWKNVTPPAMKVWSKVAQLDSSMFDDETVYAAVNGLRLDDMKPHAYRTHDGGATWKEIVRGLPDGPVNAVRADPERQGLLYAATELAVYVSFNDGDDWQPLRMNMPHTSVRDIVVHGDDLVAATHGRSFWILDSISPLRQINPQVAGSTAHLFAPSPAIRWPRNTNTDTPLPPEEPAGKNPPDGAILYYYLANPAAGPVTLEISNNSGQVVRTFSSTDKPVPIPASLNLPSYWIRPSPVVSTAPGMHRFIWDLQGPPPPPGPRVEPSMGAVIGDTPLTEAPMLPPGTYTVKLTVAGQSQTQPLLVQPDPRVAPSPK